MALTVDNFIGSFLTIYLWLFFRAMCLPDFLVSSKPGGHPETNINTKKNKGTNEKQLNEVIINGEWHEYKEPQDKAEKVEKSDKAAEIICKSEYIMRSRNRHIIWLAYQQGKVFVRTV